MSRDERTSCGFEQVRSVLGHVFRVDRKEGLAGTRRTGCRTGARSRRKLGPAWTQRERPAAGFHKKRTAEAWVWDVLAQARTLPVMAGSGAAFADAAAEWLRYVEQVRGCKPTTLRDYRTSL
jgi:integrase